jgi:hypothetical protein
MCRRALTPRVAQQVMHCWHAKTDLLVLSNTMMKFYRSHGNPEKSKWRKWVLKKKKKIGTQAPCHYTQYTSPEEV